MLKERGFRENSYSLYNQSYNLSNSQDQNEVSPTFHHRHLIKSNQKISSDFDEQFTFDQPTCKQRDKYQSFNFTDFDIRGNESTISKQLIQQNHFLRDQLFERKQTILQLESEVALYQEKLKQLEKLKLQEMQEEQNNLCDFRSQLKNVFSLNKEMEKELYQLKQMLGKNTFNLNTDALSLLGGQNKKHSKSLQHYPAKLIKIIENHQQFPVQRDSFKKDGQQKKKFEELLQSVKAMHLKITGIQLESLKQLWRWLKDIAYVYSCLRKWKNKIGLLAYSQINALKLKQLINQIINLVD